ncbi:MAG: DUF6268 family outer membrane beta-barrel protein [Chitinophagales bacterium]
MKRMILFFCIDISSVLSAQPYLDIAKINYSYSPEPGFNNKTNPLKSNFFNIELNLPVELKKNGDAFLINPFFNDNQGKVAATDFHVISQGLLLGFLKKNIFKSWDLLSGFAVRQNKETEKKLTSTWQYGGVILSTYRKNQFLSLKIGLYYNKEFFGNYFIPLVGIDWQINSKNNLFGVLPGSIAFEHKVNPKFYYGISFRALTNSNRLQTIDSCFTGDCSGKNYLRIDDNQLGVYADSHLLKKIVLSAEAGYTILRRYRYGFKGKVLDNKTDYKNDNFYFRASLAYRLRFR